MKKEAKNLNDMELLYITSTGYSTSCGYTAGFILDCFEERRCRKLSAMKVFPNMYRGL